MSLFNAHFKNINGSDTYPLDQVIYRSPIDNSLLEVEQDRKALASKSAEEWKKLFAERRLSQPILVVFGAREKWCFQKLQKKIL